ncbi:hypothetical protein AOB54_02865 [beta proteobacterium MWH-UniP1]
MSKRETPLTRRYWESVGGTLIEEFQAVAKGPHHAQRLIDGVIILGGPAEISKDKSQKITDKDIVVIQTKATRLSMSLLGQAILSIELMKRFSPRSIKSVAVCTEDDAELRPIGEKFSIEIVVYSD